MSARKYVFTPAMDATIAYAYRTLTPRGRVVQALATTLNMPAWRIKRRARELAAFEPCVRVPVWSPQELRILEANARFSPETIQRRLLKQGFARSVAAIVLKRKRLRLVRDLGGFSACQVALGFGVDPKTVSRWIDSGLLRAERRGTRRTERQGGDMYFVTASAVRDFIVRHIGIIDIRKVEKVWFVDILVNEPAAKEKAA